jgi:hypothetical protein
MAVLQQKQLFDEIDILPMDLKTKIVDKILLSLNPITNNIDDLWIKEVNQRKDDIESDKINLIDGNEVFRKIAKRLNS